MYRLFIYSSEKLSPFLICSISRRYFFVGVPAYLVLKCLQFSWI